MTDVPYRKTIETILHTFGESSVISLDLETIIERKSDFLTGEPIIAISLSYTLNGKIITDLLIAKDRTTAEEDRILSELDRRLADLKPGIIIGYNQTGYDIPLLRIKMNRRSYSNQLWNLKRYLSTAYCPDMMYIIADDLYYFDGDYRLRKLSAVVVHPGYSELKLQRTKHLSMRDDMPVNVAIETMWREEPENFAAYCSGDTRDLIVIFFYIFLHRKLE